MNSVQVTPAMAAGEALPPLSSHDGLRLFRRHWPRTDARASILLVHGLGEHSGRYQALAQWLWQRGFSVQAYDQRGHGRSEGRRGGLPQPDALLRDLAGVYAAFADEQASPPLLFGHSMGGLVCTRAVLDGRVKPTALVLSAPALRSRVGPGLQRLAGALARVAPALPLSQGLPKRYLSHDPAVIAAVRADRYCHGTITPALAEFIFKAGDASVADARQLSLPTLLLVAGDDHLVDPAGSLAFAAAAPAEQLQCQLFAESYHELFNEADSIREPVFAAVAAWLEARELA
ncbi:alpha/beta hydrolase [Frateuria aurantia]